MSEGEETMGISQLIGFLAEVGETVADLELINIYHDPSKSTVLCKALNGYLPVIPAGLQPES